MPLDVTYEEILKVEGEPRPLEPRRDVRAAGADLGARTTVQSSSVSFLAGWAPRDRAPREEVSQEGPVGASGHAALTGAVTKSFQSNSNETI